MKIPGCEKYYQYIEHPICMRMIEQRNKRKLYHSLESFRDDMTLMIDNCLSYNQVDAERMVDV